MRVVQSPESVDLIPESDGERALLKMLLASFQQPENRITMPAHPLADGAVAIWKF